MKLHSIAIKGMHNVSDKTYNLSNFTYLHGDNGVGKSTVLQAVQLALLGYIPGTNKSNTAIYRHASAVSMSVELKFDTGESITRAYTNTGKSIVYSEILVPESLNVAGLIGQLELPLFNFNEFSSMTANKLKEWFINFLPSSGSVKWDKVVKESPNDQLFIQHYRHEILQSAKTFKEDISGVKVLHQFLKDQLSMYKQKLALQQNTISGLVMYDDVDIDADEETILKRVDSLQTQQLEIEGVIRKLQYNQRIHQQLDAYRYLAEDKSMDKELSDAAAKIEEIEGRRLSLTEEIDNLKQSVAKISVEITSNSSIINGGGICPFTSEMCDSISEKRANLLDENEAKKIEQRKYEADIVNLRRDLETITVDRDRLQRIISTRPEEYKRRDMLKNQLEDVGNNSFEDVASMQQSVESLQYSIASQTSELVKIRANKKFEELSSKLEKEKYETEFIIEYTKQLIKHVGESGHVQSALTTLPFKDLETSMTEYLRMFFEDDLVLAHFVLIDKANSFDFGLMRNEKYVPYDLLSSGEKCLYTLAMLVCMVASTDAPLKVILLDDLLDHLDKKKSKSVFESLYKVEDVQLLLAGVIECNHDKSSEFVVEV